MQVLQDNANNCRNDMNCVIVTAVQGYECLIAPFAISDNISFIDWNAKS